MHSVLIKGGVPISGGFVHIHSVLIKGGVPISGGFVHIHSVLIKGGFLISGKGMVFVHFYSLVNFNLPLISPKTCSSYKTSVLLDLSQKHNFVKVY